MRYEDVLKYWNEKNINSEAELSAALQSYMVTFAYNSGVMENPNITYHDTREIFDKDGVSSYTGDLRTLFEIQNAKTAFEYILTHTPQKTPITEDFVKKVQKRLTRGTYDKHRYEIGERPGEYKKHEYVTGKNEVGALAEDVSEELSELLDELTDIEGVDLIKAAAYFHAKFENIHPFSDGNGRTGRLLMNYFLMINDHPPINIFEENRKDYYDALEAFDEDLNLQPMVDFLKFQLIKTWEHIINRDESRSKCRKTSLKDI